MPKFLDVNDLAAARVRFGAHPLVNVTDYGATGEGTEDDRSAILAAIAALPSSGGTVFFPAGTYLVSTVIAISEKSNIHLLGDGNATLKLSALGGLMTVTTGSNIRIEGLIFDGNSGNLGGAGGGVLLYLTDMTESSVTNCRFIDSTAAIAIKRCNNVFVTGNLVSNTYLWGIGLVNQTSYYNQNIWINKNYLKDCQSSEIDGNAAIQTFGGVGVWHRYITIAENSVLEPGKVGLGLNSIDQSTIRANVVIKSGGATGECIAFTGSENIFSENFCKNEGTSGAAGILLFAPAYRTVEKNQILNNRCTNSGQGIGLVWGEENAAIDDVIVAGNHCYGNGIGVQSYRNVGVTNVTQRCVVVTNNNLLGNNQEFNLVQHNGADVVGYRTVFGNHVQNALGPALGVPYSGTLTNCTGLPVSGITASTSTALGVGSIELGHASDTTIARSAAGQVSVEGVALATADNSVTFTNKTISGASNTITNLPASSIPFASRLVATSAAGGVTAENGANTWTKLVTLQSGVNYDSSTLVLMLMGGGSSNHDVAIVSLKFSNAATGANPTVDLSLIAEAGSGTMIGSDSLKLISDGFNTPIELWLKKKITYGQVKVYELAKYQGAYTTITYNEDGGWQSSTPSGTVNNAVTSSVLSVFGNPLGTKVAVPASAGATGVVGQWAAESGWLYICVATDTWQRVAIATW